MNEIICHLSFPEWPTSLSIMFSRSIYAVVKGKGVSAGDNVEKGEPFSTAGRNADWCSHCGRQYGDSSKN